MSSNVVEFKKEEAKELKTYLVTIEETLTYEIEVEASTDEEAEELAYHSEKFSSNLADDNDSTVKNIKIVIG